MIAKKDSKFPTKIKIFDQMYRISYIERGVDTDEAGQTACCGQTNFHAHTMRIYKPPVYSAAEIWNTIIHEALHVIIEALKIEDFGEEKNEERLIHLLATGINTMMIDNNLYCQKIDS